MTLSTIEAYDVIRFSEQYLERLAAAQSDLAPRPGLRQEKQWLAVAEQLVRESREPAEATIERARGLPELEDVRGELAAGFQQQWVDALEKLLAGITFHVGSRDPVIEAIFPHQKFPSLRRAGRDVVLEYGSEVERRLRTSYVTRMFSQPQYAFTGSVIEQLEGAWSKWQSAFSGESLAEEEAEELRKALVAVGQRIDLATRQARLLAEAALLPVPEVFETHGLASRPRKRAVRAESSRQPRAVQTAPAPQGSSEPAKKAKTASAEKPAPPTSAAVEQTAPAASAEPARKVEAKPAAAAAAGKPEGAAEPAATAAVKAPRRRKSTKAVAPAPDPRTTS